MAVKCFWVEPTGDAHVEFNDGRPPEIHAAEAHSGVTGWKHWRPRYKRPDTVEIFECLSLVPPGAMWDAKWYEDAKGGPWGAGKGDDGIWLVVMLPNGTPWVVDHRASNCDKPNDDVHRCWVRHGDPRTGVITVDKSGVTCNAGSGSIMSGDYHGFLQNGELT